MLIHQLAEADETKRARKVEAEMKAREAAAAEYEGEGVAGGGKGGAGGPRFQQRRPRLQILLACATNVAVDRVLKGLLDAGFESLVRVGSIKAMDPAVAQVAISPPAPQRVVGGMPQKQRGESTGADDQLLKDARVVG